MNRDKPRAYFGLGAFNLVRAEAYRSCGGYEALRLTVLDDSGKSYFWRIGDDIWLYWSFSRKNLAFPLMVFVKGEAAPVFV